MFLTRGAKYPQKMAQIIEVSIILEVRESGTYLSNGAYQRIARNNN